jgi:hypothetical protein
LLFERALRKELSMNWLRSLLVQGPMAKFVRVCGLALVCVALASPAYGWGGNSGDYGSSGGGAAPEIDPSSLAGALTLLSGGLLVLTDRFRRK